MSQAAISVFVFGCYLVLNAVVLAFAPNLMLTSLGLPPTSVTALALRSRAT